MPSLLSTLKYGYKKYVQPKRARIKHVLLRIFILLIIAAVLEVCVFNFRAITTAFFKPIDLSESINLPQTADGRFVISSNQNTIELKDINQNVSNIHFKMNKNQDSQLFNLKINFTDSGHKTFFDTTEYSVGVPEYELSTMSVRSQYFTIQSTGQVKDIRIKVFGDNLNYPLYVDSIVLNDHYPFMFLVWRFLLAFGILYLCYLFRPRSSIYKIKLVARPFYTRCVIVLTIFIQSVLIGAYLLMGSNLVGIATSNYNYGD